MNKDMLYDINKFSVMHINVKLEHLIHIPKNIDKTIYLVRTVMNMNELVDGLFFSRDVNNKCVYIYSVKDDIMSICSNSANEVLNTFFRLLLHGIINDHRFDIINEIADKQMSLKKFIATRMLMRVSL